MGIRFLGYYNKEVGSFWSWYPHIKIKHSFEIEYDIEKNFELYAKELRLNLKHQFNHNRIWRTK